MSTKVNDVNKSEDYSYLIKSVNLLFGLLLRFLAFQYLSNFFYVSPAVVTPLHSFKRFKEGVFLYESKVADAYGGDMFHIMPIFIYLIKPFLNSELSLRVLWTIFDLITAYFIEQFAINYIKLNSTDDKVELSAVNRLSNLAFIGYLWNPMSIGCWTVLSFSSITNLLISVFIFFIVKNNFAVAIFFLVFAAQLNIYYLILFSVVFLKFRDSLWTVLFVTFFAFTLLTAVNLLLAENSLKLFLNTICFPLTVPDLTPNVGIFWYFFAEVFEHYRLMFLFAFQLNAIIYIIPLTVTLRRNPELLLLALLIFVAIFSSYPSYAETALYLPIVFSFWKLQKFIRYALIFGGTIVTTFVLTPIMWRMWVITGTGNVNFFFAIVWVFNLAQIFIFVDIVSAFLRSNLVEKPKDYDKKVESIKLIDVSLI